MEETGVGHGGQARVLKRIQQNVEMRKRYTAQLPGWRHPIVGYFMTLPFVGLAISVVQLEQTLLPEEYFSAAPMFLAIVLIALIWGTRPALLAVLLSTLALDYYYITPIGQFTIFSWPGVLQVLPFIIAGFIIAIITGQRETARRRALFAEQEAQARANELAQANQDLAHANQLKDQFLSIASHELKTPITTIRGLAQIMLRRLAKDHESAKEWDVVRITLEKIDQQTQRLANLVNDLLDLSSIRAGKIKLRLSRFDIREVCRSAVEDQHLITGRSIELEVPTEPVEVQCDGERLSQVVLNLVNNALKYSPEDSSVHVSITQQDTSALIQVGDAGQGISQEQQKHVFETFYRAPDAQMSSQRGWGLGLAICKDIVERHAGRIWCESQVGKGSTFFVELPLNGQHEIMRS